MNKSERTVCGQFHVNSNGLFSSLKSSMFSNRPAFLPERLWPLFTATLIVLMPVVSSAQSNQRGSIKELFSTSHQGIVVVAHRGCHEPAPNHGFGYAPENSLMALERCVAMGVDMMETDVHKTADGYLVIMHDERVERTTNGHGNIAKMTLADLRKLRLRQNLGGYSQPLTDEHVPTLEELIKAARGRITLNLDVKDAIYAEAVNAVVRLGAVDLVNVKTRAGIGDPALAAIEPFVRAPFIPVLSGQGSNVLAVAERQAEGRPIAFELPHMTAKELSPIAAFAKEHGIKLFSNTLGDGFISDVGGDNDALRDPDAVWGWEYRNGVSVFQTDQPEALTKYREMMR